MGAADVVRKAAAEVVQAALAQSPEILPKFVAAADDPTGPHFDPAVSAALSGNPVATFAYLTLLERGGLPARRQPADILTELGHTELALGRELLAAGSPNEAGRRFTMAVQSFGQAVQERPDSVDLRLFLGEACEASGRTEEALRCYLQAMRLAPHRAAVVLPRASVLLTPALAPVVAELEERWQWSPDQPSPDQQIAGAALHSFLGRANLLNGQLDRAVAYWRRALRLEPNDLNALEGLGEALWRQRSPDAARRMLDQARGRVDELGDPERRAHVRLLLCRVLLDLECHAQAEQVARQAVPLSRKLLAELQVVLGRSRLGQDWPEDALQAAEVAIEHGEDEEVRVEAYLLRGSALADLGRFEEASEAADAVLRMRPTHSRAVALKAEALLDGRIDVDRAIRLLQVYLREQPADVARWRRLVRVLRDSDQRDLARKELKRAVRAAPPAERPALQLDLAEVYLDAEEPARALATLQELARHTSDMPARWWRLHGDAQAALDHVDAALDSYARARELGGEELPVLQRLGEFLHRAGQYQQAADRWRDYTRLAPDDDSGWLGLARALREQRDFQGVLMAVEPIIASGQATSGEAEAYELHAEALEALGRDRAEIADALFQAGVRRYSLSAHAIAAALFERAARHRPDHQPTWWHRADSLRVLSWRKEPPYADPDLLAQSLDCWEQGAGLGLPPPSEYYWAYATRAWISAAEAQLSESDADHRWWEAVARLEQALVLFSEDSNLWRSLANYHRVLGNDANSLAAAVRALAGDPDNVYLLDTRLVAEYNLGLLDQALETINHRLALESGDIDFAVAQVGLMAVNQRYQEALDLLDKVELGAELELMMNALRAALYLRLGRMQDARAVCLRIWEQRDQVAPEDMGDVGWVAYALATLVPEPEERLLDEAIAIFDRLAQDEPDDPSHQRALGLCILARGEVKRGEEMLTKAVEATTSLSDLDDLLLDLRQLQEASAGHRRLALIAAAVERLDAKIHEQREEVGEPPTPADELRPILASEQQRDTSGWPWIAVQLSLARLTAEAGRWDEAVAAYRRLQPEADRFPEVHLALASVVESVQAAGDEAVRSSREEEAVRSFERALEVSSDAGLNGMGQMAGLHARLGYAHLRLGDPIQARAHLRQALRRYRRLGRPDPGTALGEVGVTLLGDIGQFWELESAWQRLRDQASTDEVFVSELDDARRAHCAYLERVYSPDSAAAELTIPVVTPIALEIGSSLIPEDTGPNWSLFSTYIPAMRARIERRLGVVVPGVRVRPNPDLGDDGYRVLFDEIPVASGAVRLAMRYCPVTPERLHAALTEAHAAVETRDPTTGAAGCWIAAKDAEYAIGAGFAVWPEPLVFAVRHLETALRGNLAQFLGIQEVDDLLARRRLDERSLPAPGAAAPGQRAWFRLARVLRALVDEGVPIVPWEGLLDATRDLDLTEGTLSDALRAVRLALRDRLPGNGPDAVHLSLPDDWEDRLSSWLRHRGNTVTLAAPPGVAQDFIAMLERWPPVHDPGLVLTVADAELRPFVRRLVADRFPRLMVLAAEEVVRRRPADGAEGGAATMAEPRSAT